MRTGHTPFLKTLCQLRWLAVTSQAVVSFAITGPLQLAIPTTPLWSGIAALAAFNVYATQRGSHAPEATPREVFLHICVDVAVLAWLIGWSGGIVNPFTSLFLLPIAFAALALPLRWIYATAALCGLGYALSVVLGRPLPHVHGVMGDSFDLHLFGMAVNFLISAGVVLYFFSRLALALRRQDDELATLRERFARNEGIVALATHAASVAHELNTPLATMTLALDDLIEQGHLEQADTGDVADELRTLRALVEVCRERVRELAAPAQGDGFGEPKRMVDIEHVIDRWKLTRPAIELIRDGDLAGFPAVEPAVGHLLQALLNNAADASEAAGAKRVELNLHADAAGIHGEIRDFGSGLSGARTFLPAKMFDSSKADGLGIGLALGHATVERLGGALSMQANADDGLRVRFQLPGQKTA